jgi:PKHD-type hydroxylase
MLLQIPGVLTPAAAAALRERVVAANWVDGNATSGHQSQKAKYNEQLPEDSSAARECGKVVLDALSRSHLFFTAVLPSQVFPPLFNRYAPGMKFDNHVDGAMRTHGPSGVRIRTDVSATLFLTPPEDYDGGDLLIEDTYGTQRVKLPAGHMVVYPATSLHRVEPVTRGARISSFFWVESMVREDAQRSILFDLDMAIARLTEKCPDDPALVSLVGVYHNMLRMWGGS